MPPTSGDDSSTPSKAGITRNSDGQQIIPASVRPDGTTRREIKVRPGYRPPEDVEVYKNRTVEVWKNRGSGGIPGAAPASDSEKKVDSAVSDKNAKRRAARKKAKEKEGKNDSGEGAGGGEGGKEIKSPVKELKGSKELKESEEPEGPGETKRAGEVKEQKSPYVSTNTSSRAASPKPKPEQTQEEKEKLAKAIRKKIRQANELKDRKESGENLLPEQLEKVIKLSELTRQLSALGFE